MLPPEIRIFLLTATAATSLLLGGCAPKPLSPELSTPKLAIELGVTQEGGKLYFTPNAVVALPGSAEELTKQAAGYSAVFHDPKAWRALYRQERFDTLLLTGDPGLFRPLLDHLRVSRDWTLTYVDATSIVFKRTGPANPEWTPKNFSALMEKLSDLPRRDQLLFRVQVINRLSALHRLKEAKEILDETLKIDPNFTPTLTELASWHAMQGQWEAALEAATRAVKQDNDYLPAVAAEANALFAHGRFSEALQRTRRLTTAMPEDGASLYLHAKVTHAARAFEEEIVALKKIIAMAEEKQMPTGTWRVYLGQAYGVTGKGEESIQEFKLALEDPTISDAERKFASKAIERIENREPIL